MDVLAGVDETDGVDGGVPPKPRDPFGELLLNADTGDGILYLYRNKKAHKFPSRLKLLPYTDLRCSNGMRSASS